MGLSKLQPLKHKQRQLFALQTKKIGVSVRELEGRMKLFDQVFSVVSY